MTENKIAILSDIHGNSNALNEVLKDIQQKNIHSIINLGDSLYGPLDPKGTFELLESKEIISISGNLDRIILENLEQTSDIETLEYVKSQLTKSAIDFLRNLPFDIVMDNSIYCCHATPQSDSEYLVEELNTECVAVKDVKDIDKILEDINHRIILIGHSHVPRIVETDNHLIINPGSVGLPAYDDELPIYHKMENFNPRANYAIIEMSGNSVNVERVSVEYDFEKSARMAEANNRDDWAKWIRTGVV